MATLSMVKTSQFSFNPRSALAEVNGAFEPIVGVKEKINEISKKLENFRFVADILSVVKEVVERSYTLEQLGDNLQAHHLGGNWELSYNSIYRDFPLQFCLDNFWEEYYADDLVNEDDRDKFFNSAPMLYFHKKMREYKWYDKDWDELNLWDDYIHKCSSYKKNFNLVYETFKKSGLTCDSWYIKNMIPYESTEDTSFDLIKRRFKYLLQTKRPLP